MHHNVINVSARTEDSGAIPQPHEKGVGEQETSAKWITPGNDCVFAYCRAHYNNSGAIVQL